MRAGNVIVGGLDFVVGGDSRRRLPGIPPIFGDGSRLLQCLAFALAVLLSAAAAVAQPEKNGEKAKSDAVSPADKLSTEERRIAEKYKHLEDVLLRMAELNAASDPRRAALLKKTVAESKDRLVGVRFEQLVELLGKDQLSRAIENQTELDQDLRVLLELLMSENRSKSIENEKARIREYLKQLGVILRRQKDIQGRTAGDDDARRLAGEQGKVSEKTGELAREIKEKEEKGKSGADGKKGESGKGEKGEKSEGEKSDTQQQESQQNPARKRLEAAQERMKEAEKKLKEAQRKGAGEKQEEAIRELEQAKAELEEILRQLREEEITRTLAMLEARFRKMLQMEEEIFEGTVRLGKVPTAERTHNHEIEASRLSGKQSQVVVEVDKAALLLREDGTAVAFPEAIEQMRDDMQQVVARLSRGKVNDVTQGIESDIVAALKEMIAALKKAQKDQENKQKPPPGQSPSGQPQEPPLVDTLAELRMIRTLQIRVNTRTERYSKMIEGEQADNDELVEAIRRLAEREERIHRVTRDLQTGKNK